MSTVKTKKPNKTQLKKKAWEAEYYRKNREARLEKAKVYYEQNKESIKARAKQWYQDNRESILARNTEYARKNYQRDHQKKSDYAKERWKRLRLELLQDLGGAFCANCGFDDFRALQIDHVNGGGRQEHAANPQFRTSIIQYAAHIRNNIDDYQVLCANCNFIKRDENGEV